MNELATTLYAIRDEKTGQLLDYWQDGPVKERWVLDKEVGVIWVDGPPKGILAIASKQLKNTSLRIITLLVKSAKPCRECRQGLAYYQTEVKPGVKAFKRRKFCPECGRRLP